VITVSPENLKLLICSDCKEKLEKIELEEQTIGFCCTKCEIIYPVEDDIPFILAKEARNYDLEYPLIKELDARAKITDSGCYNLGNCEEKTKRFDNNCYFFRDF